MGEFDNAPPPETVEHQPHSQEKASVGCGQCGAECSGHHTEATESANSLLGNLDIGDLSNLTAESGITPAGTPEKAGEHIAHGCDHVGCACHGHEASAFGDSLFGELENNNTVSTNLTTESGHHHNHDHSEKSPHHHSHDTTAKTEAINSQDLSPANVETAPSTTSEAPSANKPATLESNTVAAAAAHASGETTSKPDNMSFTEQASSTSRVESTAHHLEAKVHSSEAELTENEANSSLGANSPVESAAPRGPDAETQSEQSAHPQNEATPNTPTKAAEQAQHESASVPTEKQPSVTTSEVDSSQSTSSAAEAEISGISESIPAGDDTSETQPPRSSVSATEAIQPRPNVETVSVDADIEPRQTDLESPTKNFNSEMVEPIVQSQAEEANTHADTFDLSEAEQIDDIEATVYELGGLNAEDPVTIESATELKSAIDSNIQLDNGLVEANDHEAENAIIASNATIADAQQGDKTMPVGSELDAPIIDSEQTAIEGTSETQSDNTAEATSNLKVLEGIRSVTDTPASKRGVDNQEFNIDGLLEDIQLLHNQTETTPIKIPEQEQQTNNIEAIDKLPDSSTAEAIASDVSIEQDLEGVNDEVSLEAVLASLDSLQPNQEVTQNTNEQTTKEQKNIGLLSETITANLQESYKKYQRLTPKSLDQLLNHYNLMLDEQEQQELLQLLEQASWHDLHDYITGLLKLRHSSEDFGQEFAIASAPSLWQQADKKLTRILTALRRFLPRTIFISE